MDNHLYDFLFKIIVVGQSSVGKTSLLHRFVDQVFPDLHFATIGVDYKIKTLDVQVGGITKTVKLQLWDTAGQERFQGMTSTYFRGAHAVILIFALNDVQSFDRMSHWVIMVNDHKIDFKVLVGNKCDLVDQLITQAQVDAFCQEHDISLYMETSAKTGQRVGQLFQDLAQRLAERMHVLEEDRRITKLVATPQAREEEQRGGGCCGGTG